MKLRSFSRFPCAAEQHRRDLVAAQVAFYAGLRVLVPTRVFLVYADRQVTEGTPAALIRTAAIAATAATAPADRLGVLRL